MNKRDMVMAQKALSARQVKQEQKLIKDYLEATKKTSNRAGTAQQLSSSLGPMDFHALQSTLPDITHNFPRETFTLSSPPSSKLSQAGSNLVNELSQRAATSKTNLRKMNSDVAKQLMSTHSMNLNKLPQSPTATGTALHSPFSATNSPSGGSFFRSGGGEDNENFFMPKVTKVRPDGATLSDIYKSKREDTWGKILQAQLREEEEQKIIKRREKLKADEVFGNLLKKQINDNQAAINNSNTQNNLFAKLEDATAKRTEDLQRKRTEDAINRHKKFISNALEDIHTKKLQRDAEMMEEITASNIMINKAKQLIAEEEQKKRDDKEYHKRYQETLFKENLENMEKKQRERLKQFEEDRRIIAENEKQFMKELKRREDALNSKLVRSSEGPAHHIVEALVHEKKRKEEQFYNNLFKTDNGLNKQLKESEDAAYMRSKSNGDELTVEWIRNAEEKEKKRREDEERNNKILETMRKMLSDQEAEDIRKREQKRLAGVKYQQDLDAQLHTLRMRSQDALTKTMSQEEILYNAELIRKTAVKL